MNTVGKEYITTVIRRLKYYKDLAEKTFEQLDENDLHFRPNDESNSVAIIVQHLAGNMLSRFTNFLTEDGEKEWRQRDDEFEIHNYSKQQVIDLWDKGWQVVFSALGSLTEDDLLKIIYIRNQGCTAQDAINRQLAHYPYHVGQIVFLAKLVVDKQWQSLSIPKNRSKEYNSDKFSKDQSIQHFTDEYLKKDKK